MPIEVEQRWWLSNGEYAKLLHGLPKAGFQRPESGGIDYITDIYYERCFNPKLADHDRLIRARVFWEPGGMFPHPLHVEVTYKGPRGQTTDHSREETIRKFGNFGEFDEEEADKAAQGLLREFYFSRKRNEHYIDWECNGRVWHITTEGDEFLSATRYSYILMTERRTISGYGKKSKVDVSKKLPRFSLETQVDRKEEKNDAMNAIEALGRYLGLPPSQQDKYKFREIVLTQDII